MFISIKVCLRVCGWRDRRVRRERKIVIGDMHAGAHERESYPPVCLNNNIQHLFDRHGHDTILQSLPTTIGCHFTVLC